MNGQGIVVSLVNAFFTPTMPDGNWFHAIDGWQRENEWSYYCETGIWQHLLLVAWVLRPLYHGVITAALSTDVQRPIVTLVTFFIHGCIAVTGNLDTQTVTYLSRFEIVASTLEVLHTTKWTFSCWNLEGHKGLERTWGIAWSGPFTSLLISRWTSLPHPSLPVAHATLM